MLNRFTNLFRTPEPQNLRELRRAQNLHYIMLGTLAVELIFIGALFPSLLAGNLQAVLLSIAALVVFIGTLFLVNLNKQDSSRAANSFIGTLWTSLIVMTGISGGSQSAILVFIGSVVVMTALVLNGRQAILFALASAGIALIFRLPGVQAITPKESWFASQAFAFAHALNFVILGLLSIRHISNSEKAYEQTESLTEKFNSVNEAFENVKNKEEALTITTHQQYSIIESLTRINTLVTRKLSIEQLLREIATELADKLDAGHVAIFILDESGNHAYLQAASSKAGQLLIEDEGYRLSVRKMSTLTGFRDLGLPEINISVGENNYRIARPVPIPDMHSDFNFPISIGNQLIGLLNIQSSTDPDNGPEWEKMMAMIATQVAIIIQNSQYSREAQEYRNQLETISGQRISDAWQRISTGSSLAYRFDRVRVLPQGEKLPGPIIKQLQAGKSGNYRSPRGTMVQVAPIQLSGQVIGVIGYELDKERDFIYPEESALLDSIAAQVSIALENARLFTETQQRAHNEQLIATVSNRIRESLDLETVLRSAALEIRQALEVDLAEIRLGMPAHNRSDDTLSG
jgi:GAF domain-containing protein/nucleoside phosphorylase